MCEIPSCRVSAVFTSFLLGGGSLPPDFANRCVKSLAVVLTWCSKVLLLGRGSLPPDFTSRCVKSLALVLAQYFQAFGLVADHFRQIVPADV